MSMSMPLIIPKNLFMWGATEGCPLTSAAYVGDTVVPTCNTEKTAPADCRQQELELTFSKPHHQNKSYVEWLFLQL